MKNRILLIASIVLMLALVTACVKEPVLPGATNGIVEVDIENDETKSFNKTITGTVVLEEAEKFFKEHGYPSFIKMDDGTGYKSISPSGNVVYLYSSDGDMVDSLTYRYFVTSGQFDADSITAGVNNISSIIEMVIGRQITKEERKEIKELFGEIIDGGNVNAVKAIKFNTMKFELSIEALSKTLMCSYSAASNN